MRLCAHVRAGRRSAEAAARDCPAALSAATGVGDEADRGRSASTIGAFEAALYLPGVIGSPAAAAPQLPLDDAANRTVRRLTEEAGLL
ncbi:hypothetical protein [Streptomyces chattanoogensis]|uniref:hypothetical protein n=1 Tax=Streptomyces chattanoogensis TaxID=66876 RepID=UPI0006B5E677|nr:hypothetical protein [Streptomyces chattanoogensis]